MKALPAIRILLMLLCGNATLCAGETGKPISLAEYRTQLQAWEDQIANFQGHKERAQAFARTLPESLSVSTPQGTVEVSTSFLFVGVENLVTKCEEAKNCPQTIDNMRKQLQALESESENFERPGAEGAKMRPRLDAILAAREFSAVHGPSLFEKFRGRVIDWLDRHLSNLFNKLPSMDDVSPILSWIVVAAVVALLGIWLYRLSRRREARAILTPAHAAPSVRGWQRWLADARAQAAKGFWKDAIHLAFWSGVARLESEGLWRPDGTRTPREYLRAIPSSYEQQPSFASLLRRFESCWYAGRPATEQEYAQTLEDLERLGCR